jgi:hypothetical protein
MVEFLAYRIIDGKFEFMNVPDVLKEEVKKRIEELKRE